MANEFEVMEVEQILLEACEGPKAQLRPWKPFDIKQVATRILDRIDQLREKANG